MSVRLLRAGYAIRFSPLPRVTHFGVRRWNSAGKDQRRIWFGVCDSLDAELAQLIKDSFYGFGSRDCYPEDLPEEITDPYVFPYLEPGDTQWDSLDESMDWCRRMFAELGLIH